VPLVLAPPLVAAVALGALRPADASWALAGGLALALAAGLRFDEAGVIFGIWAPIAARDHPDFFWTLPPERPEVNAEASRVRSS